MILVLGVLPQNYSDDITVLLEAPGSHAFTGPPSGSGYATLEKRGYCMGTVIISATACLAVFGATAPDSALKVEEVIRRAVEANNTAQKAVRSGRGEGRCVFVVKGKAAGKLPPERRYEGRCSLSFAFAGPKHWGKVVGDLRGGYHTTIYVCDRNAVLIGNFLRGNRPQGVIHERGDLFGPWGDYPTPPGKFVSESADLDPQKNRYLYKEYDAPTLERSGQLYVVQFAQKERRERYYVDPARGFHVVRAEGLEPDGYVTLAVNKTWTTTREGFWYVCKYCEESFPIRSVPDYTSWTTTLDSFEANIDIPEGVFTIDALGLPPGATITDMRFQPNKVFQAEAPKADIAALEKVIGKLPKTVQDQTR